MEEADPGLPDTRAIFNRVWGVALTRVVYSFPEARRHMLDPGLLDVAAQNSAVTADEMMDFEAQRILAAHAMATFHLKYDLVLCPTVPNPPPLADARTVNPVEALWTQWAPWTCMFNLTRAPAISVPMGFAQMGLPRSVQIGAALYRDDLVLRAARVLEMAAPFGVADLK